MSGRSSSSFLTTMHCSLKEANAYVRLYHRHHPPTWGHKFSLAAIERRSGIVHGVIIVGRPVARFLDTGFTLEVTRCCTDGTPNVCSLLYGSAWRATRALGYSTLITYTLPEEGGTSLRAAGWRKVADVRAKSWNVPGRPRKESPLDLLDKWRWQMSLPEEEIRPALLLWPEIIATTLGESLWKCEEQAEEEEEEEGEEVTI